eukprot:scaffold19249_cov32-Tisochrysis_lutea.AAC.3
MQLCMWRSITYGKQQFIGTALVSSLLTLALALLPEVLHFIVHANDRRLTRHPNNTLSTCKSSNGYIERPVITLAVSGMGCTACSAKIKSALEAVKGVASCEVEFEAGRAHIELEETSFISTKMDSLADGHQVLVDHPRQTEIGDQLCQAVRKAGFGVDAESLVLRGR